MGSWAGCRSQPWYRPRSSERRTSRKCSAHAAWTCPVEPTGSTLVEPSSTATTPVPGGGHLQDVLGVVGGRVVHRLLAAAIPSAAV